LPDAPQLTDLRRQVCVFMLERLADKTVAWVVPLYGTLKASVFVMVLCGRGQVRTRFLAQACGEKC